MTKEDVDNLFELLKLYFPNTQKVHDKVLKNAWHLLLEPYGPDEVKAALTTQLRENKNFPDAQAIAVRCSVSTASAADAKVNRYAPPTPSELRSLEKSKSWEERWNRELGEKGLPTFREAIESGITCAMWREMLEGAGAWSDKS